MHLVGLSSESFIEVPEELKVEDTVVKTAEKRPPDEICADQTKKEEEAEAAGIEGTDRPAAAVDAEGDEDEEGKLKEEADTKAAPALAVNEWEQLDMVCSLTGNLQNIFFVSLSDVIRTNISEVLTPE